MSLSPELARRMPILNVNRCNQTGARLILALALLIITYMALTPVPDVLQQSVNDKLGHAMAFALLAFMVHASWPNVPFGWRHGLPLIAYGFFLECAQYFIPGRFFSLLDVAADALGILVYLVMLQLIMPIITRCIDDHLPR